VISALLRDFSKHGEKAIAKVRRTQPAAYLKILALLVPREHKVEHSNALKAMSDEQLDAALDALRELLAQRAAEANVIEGTAEAVALPAGAVPGGYARAQAKTQVEPPDERARKLLRLANREDHPNRKKLLLSAAPVARAPASRRIRRVTKTAPCVPF